MPGVGHDCPDTAVGVVVVVFGVVVVVVVTGVVVAVESAVEDWAVVDAVVVEAPVDAVVVPVPVDESLEVARAVVAEWAEVSEATRMPRPTAAAVAVTPTTAVILRTRTMARSLARTADGRGGWC